MVSHYFLYIARTLFGYFDFNIKYTDIVNHRLISIEFDRPVMLWCIKGTARLKVFYEKGQAVGVIG
ncbi:hypothetical protein BKM17_13050 [Pseudomonas syringae group genomosp. 3]|nr:hypothetical protein BKM17_13050 [Pseudomonas syringae group genomosp. 3]